MANKFISLVDANYVMHSMYHISKFKCKTLEQFLKDQIYRVYFINKNHKNSYFIYDSPTGADLNKSILPGYKGDRGELEEFQKHLFKVLRLLVKNMGVGYVLHPTYEADQLIGTYTLHLLNKNTNVTIVASDKDFNQLLLDDTKIKIYDCLKNCWRTSVDVQERYKIDPKHFALFLALNGDSIDSVPGIEKCGPKCAADWINTYGNYQKLKIGLQNKARTTKKLLKVEQNFLDNLDVLDKCLKVTKLTKIKGLENPPEIQPRNDQKLRLICDKYELNYKKLFGNLK